MVSTVSSDAPRPDDPSAGAGRIGPFKLRGVLGQGSMGIVFDAEAPDGRRVALKTVRPSGSVRAEQTAARFAREARILQQLDHPGIVRLIDSGRDGDMLYLAMARIEGVSLLTVRRRGPLGFHPLVQLGVQVADALAHLHEAGVIHRDIKPANILIGADGQPVITDFGISGLNEAANITRQGDLLGSPGFMAPEVIRGLPTTPASDQYGLGRLLFELGARGPARRLMRGRPLLDVLKGAMQVDWHRLPSDPPWPALQTVLARMMAPEPEGRFVDARQVGTALFALQSEDALESDTLRGHVQQLDVRQTTPWEAADDDLLHAHVVEAADPPDPDERTARDPSFPAALDAAGPTAVQATPASASSPAITSPMNEATAPGSAPHEPAGLRLPGAEAVRYPPTRDGIPLEELVAQRESRRVAVSPSSEAPTRPAEPADPPWAARRTAPVNPGLPVGASTKEIARLNQANRQLREEIGQLRRARGYRVGPPVMVAVGVICLALGAVVGSLTTERSPNVPIVVLVPTSAPPAARPPLLGPETAAIDPDDRRDAAELLAAAREHLAQKNIDGALRLLRLCVQIEPLPMCHRDLGSVLTLVGDPGARRHFERYLALAPNAPDAASIRAALAGR